MHKSEVGCISPWSLYDHHGDVVQRSLRAIRSAVTTLLPSRPKGSMGNKALSHDSVFIFESVPGGVAGDVSSQENIPGRVKTLQVRTSFPHLWCCFVLAAVHCKTLLTEASKAKQNDCFWICSASWKLLL